jgi:hypothetical protein
MFQVLCDVNVHWRPTAAASYPSSLQKSLHRLLRDIPVPTMLRMWYQPDGAPPYVARQVTEYLDGRYPNCRICRFVPRTWPARTQDITRIYYFLWGHRKDVVYRQKSQTRVLLQRIIMSSDRIRGDGKFISRGTNSWEAWNCAYWMVRVVLNCSRRN